MPHHSYCLTDIVSRSPTAAFFDFAVGAERPKMALNRRGTHGRSKLGYFGLRKLANLGFYSVPHGIYRRCGNKLHPFLKIAVGGDERSQQIFDKLCFAIQILPVHTAYHS